MIQRQHTSMSIFLLLWIFGCDSNSKNQPPEIDPRSQSGLSGNGGVVASGGWPWNGTQIGGHASVTPILDGGIETLAADTGVYSDAQIEVDCRFVSGINVEILENNILLEGQTVTKTVQTVLVVNWVQDAAADSVWLRFTFENHEWYESPKKPGAGGRHRELVLGVPGQMDVTIQIVSQTVDGLIACETHGTTGAVPDSVPRATVQSYDPSLASSNRWMIGSVEDTPKSTSKYMGLFTVFIVDRRGRVVWYYLDQAWNPSMAYPRIGHDNTHIVIDRSVRNGTNDPSILKTTLDFEYFKEFPAPRLTDSMDVSDTGSLLYNSYNWLIEQLPNGATRNIWNCRQWGIDVGAAAIERRYCYSNSVAFNAVNDSVLLSFPNTNTVVEIDRQSGNLVGQWGDLPGSWAFDPPNLAIDWVHGANITPDGTLLLSSHAPGSGESNTPVPHCFLEFELDRADRVAKLIWVYGGGREEYPKWKGEAYRVPGGNTLVNYGTYGVIREVTPDGQTAWDVKWDADFSIDYINKMVGHSILIDDLYALCEGWRE